jgi:hypothetical protein
MQVNPRARSSNTDTNIVQIYNGSGADVDPFTALTLAGSTFEEGQSEFFDEDVLEGGALEADSSNIVVALEPILDGETGEGAIGGIVAVLVNVTDLSHTHVAAGASGLISANSGPLRITSPPAATGEVYLKAVFVAVTSGIPNGVVRGTAEFDFTDTTATVDVEVTFSNVDDVTVGQVVTATNWIGYSGDLGGECYVYYHGDGTGNEDGTFDLMGARCPAV